LRSSTQIMRACMLTYSSRPSTAKRWPHAWQPLKKTLAPLHEEFGQDGSTSPTVCPPPKAVSAFAITASALDILVEQRGHSPWCRFISAHFSFKRGPAKQQGHILRTLPFTEVGIAALLSAEDVERASSRAFAAAIAAVA